MFDIMVVEDDDDLRELFCSVLDGNGFKAIAARNGEEAFDILVDSHVDLIITDIMMPGIDGIELTRTLRGMNDTTPVLMITAKGGIADKHDGFRAGTDDYMVKPVDVGEMVWRVNALLRRSQIINERKVGIGDTTFDCDTLTASSGGKSITLPQKEFYLAFKLVSTPGRIFTRKQIMDELWGIGTEVDGHTLEVHISRLRERFRDDDSFEIVTVRGLGYKAVGKP